MAFTSLWSTISKRLHKYPELTEHLEVDVVIIGGGITGITAATQLIKAGKTVAVVEAFEIGGVTTSFSTGNLYVPVQPFYQSIYSKFDLKTAEIVAHSRKFAIDYIEGMIKEKNIECQFKRRPWYGYTKNAKCTLLQKEVEILKKINIEIDYTQDLPLNLNYKKAVVMLNQARFNPLQYVLGLADDLSKKGCHLFENTRVIKIEEHSKCVISTEKGRITAKKILIATHTPVGINLTHTFTSPYRSYVVAVTLKDKVYPEGHFWDLDNPPHALCTHAISKAHPEILMVAGSHHKTGQGADMNVHYKELYNFLKKHFAVEEIVYQWSAQHYQSADNVPYIGLAHHSAKHIYMATGYFADGLVYGTLAGIIMGDLLAGKENIFLSTYNSIRHNLLASFPFIARENTNVLFQYLKDMPLFNNEKHTALQKGEGRVVEINREKYAISRDSNNELFAVSAVCPHMKCIVNWNNAEETWDCPCHGSRFKPNGELIEGPAMCNLTKCDINILD